MGPPGVKKVPPAERHGVVVRRAEPDPNQQSGKT
jgi:hypothetical protein